MREKMRRLVAVIMSFMMVWCSMPVSAFAEIVKEASSGISLMSLLKPDEGTYATYRFYVDGAELTAFKQIVKTGDELIEPEAPQQEGYKFTGWKIRGTDKAPKFNIALTAEDIGTGGDVNVDAQFVQVFYVFFHDQFGKIFQTKENEPGKTVSTTDVDLPVGPTQTVTGWRIDDKENGTLAGAQFTVPEKNTDLYPVIEEGHWLTFVTPEDSEYIPPKFYKVGETTAEPTTDPKRAGYKFVGWVVEDTSETFAFGSELEDDVRLEASWTPETVEYTVNYWKEKTDCVGDNIEWGYVSSVKQEGQTGATTSVSQAVPDIDWGDNEVKEGFKFHHADSATIKGDGTTVVNVYFNRKTFNLNFYNYAGNSFAEMVSATKLIRVKTIEAKYNAYILDQWPLNPKDQSTAWQLWRENEVYTYTSSMVRMPTVPYAAKGGKMHDGNFYARPTRAYNVEFRYYLENLNGGYAEPSTEAGTLRIGTYSDTTTEKTSVTDEEILKFQGFEHDTTQGTQVGEGLHNGGANGKGDNDKWGTPKKFYYKRLSFDIVFDFQAEDVADVTKSFKYEAPINSAEFEPDASQTKKAPNGDPYTFDGWYTDPDCTQKMDFNAKMPAYNLRVYAKWYLTEVNATAHQKEYEESPDGEYHDGDSYFPSIPYGHSISEKYEDYMSRLPSKKAILEANGYEGNPDDYTIYGWVDGNDNPFNFDQKLFGHVDIYPVIGLVGPFYLEYNANGGQGNAPTDERKYRGGSAADVQNGSNLTPPEEKDDYVFLGWSLNPEAETGDYQPGGKFSFDKATVGEAEPGKTFTLYAIWGPKPTGTSITYHENFDAEHDANFKVDIPLNNDTHTVYSNTNSDFSWTHDGYSFAGWTTERNGGTKYEANTEVRVSDSENHLYANWTRDEGKLVIVKKIQNEFDDTSLPGETFNFTVTPVANSMGDAELSETAHPSIVYNSTDNAKEDTFEVGRSEVSLKTGKYTVSEDATSNNYSFVSITDENGSSIGDSVAITKNQTVTIVVTNTYRGAKLTVIKTATKLNGVDYNPNDPEAPKAQVGDVITYSITVKNDGKVTLNDVKVSDEKTGLKDLPVGTLEPQQESNAITVKYTVTSDDVEKGSILNVAIATGKDDKDEPVEGKDNEIVETVEPVRLFDVTKSVANIRHIHEGKGCDEGDEGAPAHKGDVITYRIKVSNYDGDKKSTVDLKDVVVTDSLVNGLPAGAKFVEGVGYTISPDSTKATIPVMKLEQDQETIVTLTVTYTVTQADVDAGVVTNVATATHGQDTDTSTTETPTEQNPALEVVKTAYSSEADREVLNAHETLDGYVEGDTIYYKIVVTNTGNVTLTDVKLEDPRVSDLALQDQGINGQLTLAPGDSVTFYASHQVTQDDVDVGTFVNVATAHGTSPKSETEDDVEAHDDATVVTEEPHPAIEVTKTATPTEGLVVGNTVNYSILVKNTGNVTLKPVVVTDILPGLTFVTDDNHSYDIVDGKAVIEKMAPDAEVTVHATYKIDQDDVDAGEVDNTATATGTHKNTEVQDSSSAAVTTLQNPGITIVKTVEGNQTEGFEVGDTIYFKLTVTNSGNMTLNNVTVTDSLVTDNPTEIATFVGGDGYTVKDGGKSATIDTMTPGESVDVHVTYVVQQSDVDNQQVTNTGYVETPDPRDPENEDNNLQDDDTVNVPTEEADPSISVVKTRAEENNPTGTDEEGNPNNTFAVGDIVIFDITVTNTGNVTLHDVTVTDIPQNAHGSLRLVTYENCGYTVEGDQVNVTEPMAPQASVVVKAEYTVDQEDIDDDLQVVNFAKATGFSPQEEKTEDDDTEPVPEEEKKPDFTIVKTLTNEGSGAPNEDGIYNANQEPVKAFKLGETAEFDIIVTNIGNVTLNDVTVKDTLPGALVILNVEEPLAYRVQNGAAIIPTLAPGESVTVKAVYTVTQADINDAGTKLKNIATASVPDEDIPDKNDEEEFPDEPQDPAIEVVKTADQTENLALGDTVTYSFTVTNTGNVTLTNITVSDSKLGWEETIQSLLPNESVTFENAATHVINQEDILAGSYHNSVTATGEDPDGDHVEDDDEETVTTETPDPRLKLYKVETSTPANGTAYEEGEVIEYEVWAQNTGNLTLSDVHIYDVLTGEDWLIPSLAPNEITSTFYTSHTVTYADAVAGSVLNVATGIATAPNDTPVTVEPAEVESPTVYAGSLIIVKEVTSRPSDGDLYKPGDTVTYRLTVTNNGNVNLNNVVVSDPLTGNEWTIPSLPVGQSESFNTDPYTVTEEDARVGYVENVATANGKDPEGKDVPEARDEVTVDTVLTAHLKVTKVATSTPANGTAYALGETITYNVMVTNDSLVTANDVVVTDPLTGDEWIVGTLEPGESSPLYSTSYVVTEADTVAGHVLNVATATGKDPDGNDIPTDPGEDDEPTVPPTTHVTLTKTATSTPANGTAYALGETITYSVTITNDGATDVTNVVVTDELTGDQWTLDTLAAGGSASFPASHVVTEADVLAGHVLNVVTATATGPDPDNPDVPIDPAEDDEPTVPAAHLTLVKTATSTPANGTAYGLGETITYDVTITNDGVADVTDVVVTDELTGDQWTLPFLASGDSATFTTSHVVTVADVVAGHVLNVVTGTATGPDPENPDVPVDPDDDDEPTVSQAHLSIFKTATSTPANGIAYVAGEIVTYSITALNDGIIELLDVVVTDDLTGSSWTIPSMQPGESQTFTTTYVVTDADAQAGYVLNVATATATSPDPNNPPTITPDEEIVPAAPTYTLTIQYLYLDGTVAAETYFQDGLVAGMTYDVTSPVIPGFTATQPVVAGTMPAANVLVTVFYAPTPAAGPGGPGLVTLDEYGVPLNIGNLVMNVGDCFE